MVTGYEVGAYRALDVIAASLRSIDARLAENPVLTRSKALALLDGHTAYEGEGGGTECFCGWPSKAWFMKNQDVTPDYERHLIDVLFPAAPE